MDYSPKVLTYLSRASVNILIWISNSNFKPKMFKSEVIFSASPFSSTRPTVAILLLIHVQKPNR